MANQPVEVFIMCSMCKTLLTNLDAKTVYLPASYDEERVAKLSIGEPQEGEGLQRASVCECCRDAIADSIKQSKTIDSHG